MSRMDRAQTGAMPGAPRPDRAEFLALSTKVREHGIMGGKGHFKAKVNEHGALVIFVDTLMVRSW